MWRAVVIAAALGAWALPAPAHVSGQGFVLLLPTDAYIAGGVASVVLTVALLAALSPGQVARVFAARRVGRPRLPAWVGWGASAALALLIAAGVAGPSSPVENPLPLAVWTGFWIALVSLQGLVGDHWRWTNPWRAPGMALARATGAPLRLSRGLGRWLALAVFATFAGWMLAGVAPADPRALARVVLAYSGVTLAGAALFGPRWFLQVEAMTVMMRLYARIAPMSRGRIGLWGWRLLSRRAPPLALGLLSLFLLGTGSFDGLNETFLWLAWIGVNPLEYPGRSAVVAQNLAGLALTNAVLVAAFALMLRLGGGGPGAMRRYAPALLPIALAYHVAHYLPSLLVDIQWLIRSLSDPFGSGADLFGTADLHVTTGFFKTPATVKLIWLTQAGVIVAGHMLSLMLSHALAGRAGRGAFRAQLPLATFMVVYTLFGLWLLAAPRGA